MNAAKFALDYEIESLCDEEPGIKIQLSQTNQTLAGQNNLSAKTYFGQNSFSRHDLNVTTNSYCQIAAPSTMPVNKTFKNNK